MNNKLKMVSVKDSDINDNNLSMEEESLKSLNDIVENYKILIKDEIVIIEKIEVLNISKQKVLYDIIFGLELILKLYLIKDTRKKLADIGAYGHNIDSMIGDLKKCGILSDIDKVENLLKFFKDNNNHRISFNEYYHIRYNHQKGSEQLLFTYKLSEIEVKKIKEVIGWMKNHLEKQ